MDLWLIYQDKNNDYDTYDSAVVAAETIDEALVMHPGGPNSLFPEKDCFGGSSWVPLEHVRIKYIGLAFDSIKASFNAG